MRTSVNAGVDWLGTVRGRVGYLFTPTMLVYATGGLTYGGVYANVNNYAVASSSQQLTLLQRQLTTASLRYLQPHLRWRRQQVADAGRLERRWRPRVDVHAELVAQGGSHLLEHGQHDLPTVAFAAALRDSLRLRLQPDRRLAAPPRSAPPASTIRA